MRITDCGVTEVYNHKYPAGGSLSPYFYDCGCAVLNTGPKQTTRLNWELSE